MCKTRLKPRWITILTGVAICALVCVYSTSGSWAAMCMVGYNSSACSGKSSVPVPPTSTGDENGNSNPEIATDCERLGYAERGAKPNSNLWPKRTLKNGVNDTAKWVCDVCQKGGTAVRDKSGYARYNCYLKCQNEGEATNIEGGTGRINGWDNASYSPNSAISRPSYSAETNAGSARIYRDQFVRTQAECNTLFKSKMINGKWVPNKKFYWVTRNVCGQCIEQPCDGAEIIPGCYDVCDNKYTLENGTQCCNKLDKLVSLNPAYGDPDYWYPRTSPLYHESGCYNTTTHATAYGDFNNLPDSDVNTYCYHQVKMTCPGECDEPKEDNGCECGPKSCETLAEEKGLTFSASTGNIVENSVMYHFDNGNAEKINDICYQKTLASDCPSSGCYTLSKLKCPNGKPNDDCSCGVGCPIVQNPFIDKPQQTIPESEYNSNSNYINGKVKTDAEGNPIKYCLELSSDGTTCATWSKCYEYNECSDFGDFLVPDGSGGCTCGGTDAEGRTWKTGPGGCDIDNGQPVAEKRFSPPEGNIYKHDMETPVTAIACQIYDGVICQGVLSEGPDDNCECHCTGDYASYDKRGTYKGYSDWTEDSASAPACTITTKTATEYGYWTNKYGRKDIEIICHRYEAVDCPSGTHIVTSNCSSTNPDDIKNQCECDSGTQINGSGKKPENADGKVYSYSVDHQAWTSTDGSPQTISCYDEGTKDCGDKLLVGNDCVDCDYLTAHDSDFEGSWTEGAPNSCDCGHTEWSKTYTSNGKSKTCTKCENNTTNQKDCPAGYSKTNTRGQPNGDNEWWCAFDNGLDCVAWENGYQIICYKGTESNAQYARENSLSVCNTSVDDWYRYKKTACTGNDTPTNRCAYACDEWHKCEMLTDCPDFTSSTCASGFVPAVPKACTDEGRGYCTAEDGKLCYNESSSSCMDRSFWVSKGYLSE